MTSGFDGEVAVPCGKAGKVLILKLKLNSLVQYGLKGTYMHTYVMRVGLKAVCWCDTVAFVC